MKKTVAFAAVGIAASLTASCIFSAEKMKTASKADWELPGWKLVWHDEFDKNGAPDPKDWTFEEGFCRNHEAQWYQKENAVIKDGCMIITCKKEEKPRRNPNYVKGSGDWARNREWIEYTSASLTTRGKHTFQYGRFEVRAKLPMEDGMWPAFWTVGAEGESWPAGGEIDIMEYYQQQLLANVAWSGSKTDRWAPHWITRRRPVSEFEKKQKDFRTDWHVYSMEWDADYIRLYVDDYLMNETRITDVKNMLYKKFENPFHQKHYLWVNLAMGGDNGGDYSKVKWPKEYVIDYIRAYEKAAPDEKKK